jgi:hypothetical protein
MLAKDEFDLRVGQTLASRTCAELTALTADLLAGLTTAQLRPPAREKGEVRIPRLGRVLTVATVVYAGVWPVAFALPTAGRITIPMRGSRWCCCHLRLLDPCVHVGSAEYLGLAGQAFRSAATAGASAWRGRSGIPAPAISWPGWATPAVVQLAATASIAPFRAPVRDRRVTQAINNR